MNAWEAALLGVVEGLTEFLPVSSTGHLQLTERALGLNLDDEFLGTFTVVIQFGAILAVVLLYWRVLLVEWPVIWRVALAFAATGAIAYPLRDEVRTMLKNPEVTVWALLIGGNVLILFELFLGERPGGVEEVRAIPWWQALLIGVFQAVAIIPGVSRSAATILGGLALGMRRKTIVEFSFLLAVPTIAAAAGTELVKKSRPITFVEVQILAIGLLVSFIVALLAIKLFLRFVKNHSFLAFGAYRIVIAFVAWFWLLR